MKKKVTEGNNTLWCIEKGRKCEYLEEIVIIRCSRFNKALKRDTRLHRDGTPMKTDECLKLYINKISYKK